MSQLVYFDNNLIKSLITKPQMWDIFYDTFLTKFGEHTRPIYSYYLFFEYFDFHKSNFEMPSEDALKKIKGIGSEKDAVSQRNRIVMALERYFDQTAANLENQLLSMSIKKELLSRICNTEKYESNFIVSTDLKKILFKDILNLIENDYATFAKFAANHLAWDYFCDASVKKFIKKVELDFWSQLWEKGVLFPFGKIADDLNDDLKFKPSSNTAYKGLEDMADSEAIAYALLGCMHKNNDRESVNIITTDNPTNIKERLMMGANIIRKIEDEQKKFTPRFSGKVYCLKRDNLEFVEEVDASIPILL
jgi:hypothetical protein